MMHFRHFEFHLQEMGHTSLSRSLFQSPISILSSSAYHMTCQERQ